MERNIVHAHGMISQISYGHRLAVRSSVRGGGTEADQKKDDLLCVFLNPTADWFHATSASQKTLPTITPSSKVCRGPAQVVAHLPLYALAHVRTDVHVHVRTYALTRTYGCTYVHVHVRAVPSTVSRAKWTRILTYVRFLRVRRPVAFAASLRASHVMNARTYVHTYVRTYVAGVARG